MGQSFCLDRGIVYHYFARHVDSSDFSVMKSMKLTFFSFSFSIEVGASIFLRGQAGCRVSVENDLQPTVHQLLVVRIWHFAI